MERKVKICADSTCDLSDELIKKYDIGIVPLCIVLNETSYFDKEELTPEDIFRWSDENRTTPKTSAVTIERTMEILKPYMDADMDVVFLGISEDMSTTCNVLRLVANEFERGRVFVVDSMNLSTGIGLQVIRAAQMSEEGKTAEEIVSAIECARPDVRASFVVDTLTYLARGGRCSGVTALLANTLKLHPRIEVKDGKMIVGTKYRGKINKVLLKYTKDMEESLKRADPARVFITHSGVDPEVVEEIREYLRGLDHFEEIIETRAGGVISSHCGPGTLGVLFYQK